MLPVKDVAPPEIRTLVYGWDPRSGEVTTLATSANDEYTIENLHRAVSEALDAAVRSIGSVDLPQLRPQLSVWLRSERGLAARMALSVDLIQRIAAAGASVDFDPYMYDGMDYLRPGGAEVDADPVELTVSIIGWNPASGEELAIASSSRDEYTFESAAVAICEAISNAREEMDAPSLARWNPEVVVRPKLRRDERPSMHFTSDLMRRIADLGASLDFSPSVDEASLPAPLPGQRCRPASNQ